MTSGSFTPAIDIHSSVASIQSVPKRSSLPGRLEVLVGSTPSLHYSNLRPGLLGVPGTLCRARTTVELGEGICRHSIARCQKLIRIWADCQYAHSCRIIGPPVKVRNIKFRVGRPVPGRLRHNSPGAHRMSFRSVFLAVVIAFALILSAFLINRQRPSVETAQPTADFVRASGKCAECHARLQYSVVHEYEMSAHAKKGINCLDCHQPGPGQQKVDHHGFTISSHLTAGNCRSCHEAIYTSAHN
jgi:hypothetical protein